MKICHAHNLSRKPAQDRRYGIRVSLPPGDTFQSLLGESWERVHWYATERQRDRALEDMASEHLYSRRGDRPTIVLEKIERTES